MPLSNRVLCATSAEDNTIKISEWLGAHSYGESAPNRLKALYTYPETDGTLQNVCWSPSTSNDSAVLFVTAAKERLYALSVKMQEEQHAVQVLKVGEARHGEAQDVDSRTMALSVTKFQDTPAHLLLAGSSDGSLKVRACFIGMHRISIDDSAFAALALR